MPAIDYGEVHGFGPPAASWDSAPPARGQADAAQVLAAFRRLDAAGASLEREQMARLSFDALDQASADLYGWGLANRPDPFAPPPMSAAERRRRELSDRDVIQSWHER